jgi:hypothetical protein
MNSVWLIGLAAFCLGFGGPGFGLPESGNRFALAQLKIKGDQVQWDPYPFAARDILAFLQQTTSLKAVQERRIVALGDPMLFQSPFVIYSGSGKRSWSREEREILKKYLTGGGFLFVEDRAGEKGGSFDYSFRSELKTLFPEKTLAILPREHAVFRSFYLLRSVGGRKLTNNFLEGLDIDGRTALIYSQNDILGAWAKDLLGNFLFPCSPGGEAQRWESQKLMMNIILYSVTGTYKTDSIHIPFIEDKLRR